MANVTPEERKTLKGRGIVTTKDGNFIARVISTNGVYTNEQMQAIVDAAKKYGDGRVAMTTRLTVEIQGVTYENAEPLIADMEAAGLWVGGTGSIVRPVVSCKGTVCVHGLMDTQAFCDRVFREFFVKWHEVKLPHKFKIGIGGCPNNCVKPGLHDFGIIGTSVPDFSSDLCRGCRKCAAAAKCPVKVLTPGADGKIVKDDDKCTDCGKCVNQCPFGCFTEKAHGYRVTIGGIWGKTQRLSNEVPGVYSEDEVMKLIEKAILLYREQGISGERFGRTIDRIGPDNFIAQLLSDDVLSRKEAILAEKKHTTGGATC